MLNTWLGARPTGGVPGDYQLDELVNDSEPTGLSGTIQGITGSGAVFATANGRRSWANLLRA